MFFSHFWWSGTVAQPIAGYDKTVRYQITSPPAIIKSSTQCRAALEGIEWKTPKLVSFHHLPEARRISASDRVRTIFGHCSGFPQTDGPLNHLKTHLFTYRNGPSCAK